MHGRFVGFVVASRLVDNAFYFIKFTKRIKNGIRKMQVDSLEYSNLKIL